MGPFISVIVPVYNAERFLSRCLDALLSSSYGSFEVIVVDDASTDDSVKISRKKGVEVLQMKSQSGPAAARNVGVRKARGEILFFVDSDVVVEKNALARVAEDLLNNPAIAAVFGSYDDEPAETNFLSQYKNLQHHFVHQYSSSEATTFWSGCGAVRRRAFDAVGGFDPARYSKPSIEDIELGYRLRKAGYRILLDKELHCKHLKKWNLVSWLRADILGRAVPWSQLMLQNRGLINDLNLKTSDRVSAASVGVAAAVLPLIVLVPQALLIVVALLAVVLLLNYKFYRFFVRRRGLVFLICAFPTHLLYFFYSGLTFLFCWSKHQLFAGARKS
jgi:glycosyltransferase involved in cell wall biosynthesis